RLRQATVAIRIVARKGRSRPIIRSPRRPRTGAVVQSLFRQPRLPQPIHEGRCTRPLRNREANFSNRKQVSPASVGGCPIGELVSLKSILDKCTWSNLKSISAGKFLH